MVGHNISNCLCISGRARPTAVDMVCDPSQLIRDSVSDVSPSGGAGVSADDYSIFEFTRHDGGSGTVGRVHPVQGWIRV